MKRPTSQEWLDAHEREEAKFKDAEVAYDLDWGRVYRTAALLSIADSLEALLKSRRKEDEELN